MSCSDFPRFQEKVTHYGDSRHIDQCCEALPGQQLVVVIEVIRNVLGRPSQTREIGQDGRHGVHHHQHGSVEELDDLRSDLPRAKFQLTGDVVLTDQPYQRFDRAATKRFTRPQIVDKLTEETEQHGGQSGQYRHGSAEEGTEHDSQTDHDEHLQPDADVSLSEIPLERSLRRLDVEVGLSHTEILRRIIATNPDFKFAVVDQVVEQVDFASRTAVHTDRPQLARNPELLGRVFLGFKTDRLALQGDARISTVDNDDAPHAGNDIALEGSKDAQRHGNRQVIGEGLLVDALEGPDGGGQRAAFNVTAVLPLLSHTDARADPFLIYRRVAVAIHKSQAAINRDTCFERTFGRTDGKLAQAVSAGRLLASHYMLMTHHFVRHPDPLVIHLPHMAVM